MDSVLDDQNFIGKIDKSGAIDLALANAKQLEYDFKVKDIEGEFDSVLIAGMGGSALGALLVETWLEMSVPIQISRDYSLPKFINSRTLVILSSFSGNTEETLECFDKAEASGAKIVCIANRGELEKRANTKGYVFVKLPDCPQPRFAAFYGFKAITSVLVSSGLADKELLQQINNTSDFLKTESSKFAKDIKTSENPAKQLALEIMGKTPVIYGGHLLSSAAYKWKISFNENAKNVAWCGVYPEFNHNEFIGWSSHPIDKPYAVIDLRSSFDHPQVKKRFEISDRLLSGKRPKAHVINAVGNTELQQMLWAVTFGDFVSLYLAVLNEVDPTPVDLVEKMKQEL